MTRTVCEQNLSIRFVRMKFCGCSLDNCCFQLSNGLKIVVYTFLIISYLTLNNWTVKLKSQIKTVNLQRRKRPCFVQNNPSCSLSLQGENQVQNNCFCKYFKNFRKILFFINYCFVALNWILSRELWLKLVNINTQKGSCY